MIPNKIHLINFKSFEDSSINLKALNSPILVIGENRDDVGASSNGSGKTAGLMDSISWNLMGLTPKMKSVDEVIKEDKDYCIVDNEYNTDFGILRVIRERKRSDQKSLKYEINGIDKSSNTDTQTQLSLLKLFKINQLNKDVYNDFLNTVYFSSSTFKNFISTSTKNKDRIGMLTRFLSLDRYDDASEKAKEFAKGLKDKINDIKMKSEYFEKQLNEIDIEVIKDRVEKNEAVLKLELDGCCVSQLKKEETEKVHEVINKINQITQEQRLQTKIFENEITFLMRELGKIGDDLKNIDTIKQEKEKLEQEWNELNKELKSVNPSEKRFELENELLMHKTKINNFETSLKDLNKYLSNLENKKENPLNCPKCKTDLIIVADNLEVFKDDSELIENEKKKTKREISITEKILKELKLEAVELNEEKKVVQNLIVIFEKTKQSIYEKNNELKILNNSEDKILQLKNQIEEKRIKHNEAMILLIKQKDLLKKSVNKKDFDYYSDILIKDIEEEIFQYKLNISKLESQIKEDNKIIIVQYKELKDNIIKLEKEYQYISKDFDKYEFLKKGFYTIKTNRIEGFLPDLERGLNYYLSIMDIGINVNFSTVGKTKANEAIQDFNAIVINKNGYTRDLDTYSSGQYGRMALCTGMALREQIKLRDAMPFDFLLIDEFADGMDSAGCAKLPELFQSIDDYIIAITHRTDDIHNLFDSVIKIIFENSVSRFDTGA